MEIIITFYLIKKDKELSSLFISEKCVKQLVEYENGIKIYNCYSVNEFDEEEYLSLKISLDDSLNSDTLCDNVSIY